MIFAQENVQLICDHWETLMPGIPLLESYLSSPVRDVDEEGNMIDVGQHDDGFEQEVRGARTKEQFAKSHYLLLKLFIV